MFGISTNTRSIIYSLVACFALAALSTNRFCLAQNRYLNALRLESLVESLTPQMRDTPLGGLQLLCSSRPTGCTDDELAQARLAECAEFELDTKSAKTICVKYERETTTTTSSPSTTPEPLTADELKRRLMRWKALEAKFAQLRAPHQQDEEPERTTDYKRQQIQSYIRPASAYTQKQQHTPEYYEISNNKRCKELDGGECRESNDGSKTNIEQTKIIEPSPSSFGQPGDTKGGFSLLNHELRIQPKQVNLYDEYRYRKQQPEVRSPQNPELPMTNDELARRLNGGQLGFPPKSASSSKVPIILVQFGAIQNQRRSTLTEAATAAAAASTTTTSKNTRSKGRVWSPVSVLPFPSIRSQRSESNDSLSANQIELAKGLPKVDGVRLVNRTMDTGSLLMQQPHYPLNSATGLDSTSLDCNMRRYTYKAIKSDASGNRCSGMVSATICYGGCETGEVADWLFPHKKAIHKVCTYGGRIRRKVILDECSSLDVDEQLREYYYVDAKSCVCQKCTSHDTNCMGSLTRPHLGNLDDLDEDMMIID